MSDYRYTNAGRADANRTGPGFSAKGSNAGKAFDSSDEVKRKKRANSYRTKYRKSFAWQPPKKKGEDAEWDKYNDEEDRKEKSSSGREPLAKTGM